MRRGSRLLVTSRAWPVYEWMGVDAAPVADAVCFLLAPAARAITGTVLQVDAGHAASAAPLRHERS